MSDFLEQKCEWELLKIKDSNFQCLGVIKIEKTSSNLALYFRMSFLILVHDDVVDIMTYQTKLSTKSFMYFPQNLFYPIKTIFRL